MASTPEQREQARRHGDSNLDDEKMLRCEQYGRTVQIHLSHGNYPAARAVLKRAEAELEDSEDRTLLANRPLSHIMPQRIANALESGSNATQVRDLAGVTIEQMLAQPNIGFGSLNVIFNRLVLAIVADANNRREDDEH